MNERVYSIEQLNQYIRSIFDAEELLHNIKVSGEISGFKISGRHAYFDLKDVSAQIPCTFFNYKGDMLKDGEKVVVTGSPNFYVARGRLSLNATRIESMGEGELFKLFLELKAKLEREGLFDRKIPQPKVIRKIGIITSPTGAVIHDIVNVATRRDPSIDIMLLPVKVQGIGAAEELANAVIMLDHYKGIDAIVIGRGGGSMEDLQPFNDEIVARAVAQCDKYIVSAVGHETDFTLCDFCADLRAPTPSAAAELLTEDARERKVGIIKTLNAVFNALNDKYKDGEQLLRDAVNALIQSATERFYCGAERIKDKLYACDRAVTNKYLIAESAARSALQRLELTNPIKILEKGYACVFTSERVKSVKTLKQGDGVRVQLSDGSFSATVDKIETNKESV